MNSKAKEKKKCIIVTIDRPDGDRDRRFVHVILLAFLLAYEVFSASVNKAGCIRIMY